MFLFLKPMFIMFANRQGDAAACRQGTRRAGRQGEPLGPGAAAEGSARLELLGEFSLACAAACAAAATCLGFLGAAPGQHAALGGTLAGRQGGR